MGDFLSKWWPTVLGVSLLVLAGVVLWPEDAPVAPVGAAPVPMSPAAEASSPSESVPQPAETERRKALEDARLRADLEAARSGVDARARESDRDDVSEGSRTQPPTVTLTQNSPQVQSALRLVEVELYETSWCQYCRKTRAYLDRSGISYRAYDIEADETAKIRRQRLAPGTGVPLTMVDGQPIQGFSEQALNAAFQSAVQRRIAAR